MKRTTTCYPPRPSQRRPKQHYDRVVTHYPVSTFDTGSSSSADLHLESARKTISTPILQASGDNVQTKRRLKTKDQEKTENKNDMVLKQSSSFIVTNSELPIVDISAFDYDAYRYKLIEAALKKQYDNYQPPGDVVFNSIHLNNEDSTVAVRLSGRHHCRLFDFVEEHCDATTKMSKKETEYLHPLDHFLVKGTQKPETVEQETETKRVDVTDASAQDEKLPRISFHDDTGVGCSRLRRQDCVPKRNTRSPRSSSADVKSPSSQKSVFSRSSRNKSAPKSSRTTSSADTINSKRDSVPGSKKLGDKREILSPAEKIERELVSCTTASSIDSESVRSESSKFRDNHSLHSRDSSVASKRSPSEKTQPCTNESPRLSFGKKYSSTGKSPSKMFDATRENSVANKSSIPSKQSIRQNSEPIDQASIHLSVYSKTSVKENPRFHSSSRIADSKFSHLGRLEAIKSETEELPKEDSLSSRLDVTTKNPTKISSRSRSLSKEYSIAVSMPGIQMSDIDSPAMLPLQTLEEPRLSRTRSKVAENEKENAERRSRKLSTKQEHPERLGKVCRDRRQRSQTVCPVLSKPTTKMERSTDVLSSRAEFRENVPITLRPSKNNQQQRATSEETVRSFREYVRSSQAKMEPSSPRLNACGKKSTLDSIGNRERDSNRRKGSSIKNPGSTSNASNGLSAGSKMLSGSRTSQQRTPSSRLNGSLHDNAIGARSMQIRSCGSPASEGKASNSGKPEKSGGNQEELKGGEPDGLQLPRRDSKAGVAMQVGLKKYIKKLKRVLSNRDNTDISELATLSLTDAILPGIESTLSSIEIQQVQNLLNMAEKKSEVGQRDLAGMLKNEL